MKTAKDLELSLLLKESHIQQLKLKNKELQHDLDVANEMREYLHNIIRKATNYVQDTYYWNLDNQELLDILRGEDDEN